MDDAKELDNGIDSGEEMTMAELLGPDIRLENGRILTVKIIGRNDDGFLVDLGTKSDGLIPIAELDDSTKDALVIGAQVQVMVVRMFSQSGYVLLSHKQIREKLSWDAVQAAHKAGTPVNGTVRRRNKGGYTVDLGGVDAFCPASQIDLRFSKDGDQYLGKTFPFTVIELGHGQRNVVVSRRKLLDEQEKTRKTQVVAGLVEGTVVAGKVTGITDFGAFVDIGGIEGLLHIGDIAWYRVKKVADVLSVGQQVTVKITKVDRERNKLSLSLKALASRPWEGAPEKYPVGLVVKGTVSSIADFGVFVQVEPGLEGLVHQSEVAWDDPKPGLKKRFTVGQEVEAKVLLVDPAQEKLSLSIKRLQQNPWEEAARRYAPGDRVKGSVVTLMPFGAFVRLPEGVEGLVHVSDISWTKKVRHPQDVLAVGAEVEAVVLEVSAQNEKISLSLKHLTEDPAKKYRVGKVVTGTVKRLTEFGAFVELEPEFEALIRASEITPRRDDVPGLQLSEGQTVEAKVVKNDPKERKIEISVRKLEQERERELVKKYANKEVLPSLGDMLTSDEEDPAAEGHS